MPSARPNDSQSCGKVAPMVLWLPLLALACKDREPPDSSDFVCPELGLAPSLADAWALAEPAPGGDLVLMAVAPSDLARVYSVSHHNGLHSSSDGGHTWTRRRTEITHMGGQLAVHPTDPDRIAFAADYLYLSDDAGLSSARGGLGGPDPGARVRGLLWRGDLLYAADQDDELWRSEDGGQSFSLVTTLPRVARDGGSGFHGLMDDWWGLFEGEGGFWAARHAGELVWVPEDGPPELVHPGPIALPSVAVLAGAIGYAVENEAFVIDPGETPRSLGRADAALTASVWAADGAQVFFTDSQAWPVVDGAISAGTKPDMAHHLACAVAVSDGGLLVGHKDGIVRSDDRGATFAESDEGLVDNDLSVLAVHPSCPGLVWAGTQCERGLFMSTAWGDGMDHIEDYMHYVMEVVPVPGEPYTLWASSDDQVFRSNNLGFNWDTMLPDDMRAHVHGLAVDPEDPDHVLVGSVGSGIYADAEGMSVYRTVDGGFNWVESDQGLPQSEASAHQIHFSLAQENVVLLGTFRGGDISHDSGEGVGLWRSTDGGSSWSDSGLAARNIAALAECDSVTFAATDQGLYRSTDAGETWESTLDGEQLAVACHGATVVVFERPGWFWRSDDAGLQWEDFSPDGGLTPQIGDDFLHDLAISPDGSMVFAAIRGHGLYRRPL